MFNKQLKKDIAALKKEVYGEPKKEESTGYYSGVLNQMYGMYMGFTSYTLKERIDRIEKTVDRTESDFKKLLAHFNLESYKITEENGSTKIKEGYRTKKKVVAPKKKK